MDMGPERRYDLFDLRIIADYRPEPVDPAEVSEAVKRASAARGFFLQ